MNKVIETFNALLEPIGMKVRNFVLDYRDDFNNYYWKDINSVTKCDNATIIRAFIDEMSEHGFTVYAIYELINGYSKTEIDEMAEHNPYEAMKHVKILYCDKNKEKALV